MSTPDRQRLKEIGSLTLPGGGRLIVALGDLLAAPCAGIVNAANAHLAHGGGVAAVIARAAGPELDRQSREWVACHGPVAPGAAALTGAGVLSFRGVVHAVGPRWGEGAEEDRLVAALAAAFTVAADLGWPSLAFPAVSAGIFGVPPAVCARAYRRAAEGFFAQNPASPLRDLWLCLFPGPLLDEIRRAWGLGDPPE